MGIVRGISYQSATAADRQMTLDQGTGQRYRQSRMCISRQTNPVVLRGLFIKSWHNLCKQNNAGDLRARHLIQRRLAIMFRSAALCMRDAPFNLDGWDV